MSVRKLKALGYPQADVVDWSDETHFRKIIGWLEDQKIRQWPIENREPLRADDSWSDSFGEVNRNRVQRHTLLFIGIYFNSYLMSVGCPFKWPGDRLQILDWLLRLAIHLEYTDNKDKYKDAKAAKESQEKSTTLQSANDLDRLDFESDSFKAQVNELAKTMKIMPHSDHHITLKAISKLIAERLSDNALKTLQQKRAANVKDGDAGHKHEYAGGKTSGDPVLDAAAQGLRLLHVHNMRHLQTSINELIVQVQDLTADPRTDDRLGKVGF